jgi:hypothetical protein
MCLRLVLGFIALLFSGTDLSWAADAKTVHPPEHLPAVGNLRVRTKTFTTGDGVSFAVPENWKQGKTDDKDCVVKFEGEADAGQRGEITLNKNETPGSTPVSVKNAVEGFIFSQLKDFKKIQDKKVAIGSSNRIPAYLVDATFTMSGLKFSQRYVFFELKSGTYNFVFTSSAAQFDSLVPIFNNTLSTIRSGVSTSGGGVLKPPSEGFSPNMVRFRSRSKLLPVSFCYPEGWKVEEGAPGSDEAVKVAGLNQSGTHGAIVLHRSEMPAGVSIETVADMLEKDYFEPNPGYRRVTRQTQNFGVMSNLTGVVQEQSFERDGHTVKQMVAMFYHGDRTYALSIYAPEWKDSDIHQLFAKVLASVHVQD